MKKLALSVTAAMFGFAALASLDAEAAWNADGATASCTIISNNPGYAEVRIGLMEQKEYGVYADIGFSSNYPPTHKDSPEFFDDLSIFVDGKLVQKTDCRPELCGAGASPLLEDGAINALMKGNEAVFVTEHGKAVCRLDGSAKAIKSAQKNRYKF